MRNKLIPLWVLLALFAGVMAGCMAIAPDFEGDGTVPPASEETMPPPAQGASALPGTGWLLTRYAQDGELGLVPGRVVITADFLEDGTFATTACNSMSSTFEIDGSSLTIPQGAQTMMLCDGLIGEIEPVYFALLGEVASYEIVDSVLTLSNSDGDALLEFVLGVASGDAAAAPSLANTNWLLTDFWQDGGLNAVPADISITASFGTDTFSGVACNNYFSSLVESGDALAIGPIASTMMMCEPPLGEIESSYFAAIENVSTFTIDEDGTLKLWDPAGILILAFAHDAAAAGSTMPADTSSLDGTNWQVTQFLDDGELVSVADGVVATASFAGGMMTGQVCNSYNAAYTVDGTSLTLEAAAMTMMACMGDTGVFEPVYHQLLDTVAQFEQADDTLTLSDADGNVVLVFAAIVPAALEGTSWLLTNVNNGNDGVIGLLEGTVVTASFADGSVGGSGGCNTYGADFTMEGNGITIGIPFSTMMFCSDPEGVSEQEGMFLAALPLAATWTITGDVLELRDAADALQARFVAATGE